LKEELTTEQGKCSLQEIPLENLKKTNKKTCQICKEQKKPNPKGQFPQTRYWCSLHQVPICIIGCYDAHLVKITSLRMN